MGKSNDQVIGYKYFTNFLLFIGNPIEKLLGINFDKRGWIDPFTDEDENILDPGVINSPSLYGETEGGVAGAVYLKTGTNDQAAPVFYQQYMESKGLVASGRPFESWLAFQNFYVGNSGYMKEMLLWPKRIHVRNDGREQWYDEKSEIGRYLAYFESEEFKYNQPFDLFCKTKIKPKKSNGHESTGGYTWTGVFSETDNMGGSWSVGSGDPTVVYAESPIDFSLIYTFPGVGIIANIVFVMSRSNEETEFQFLGALAEEPIEEIGTDGLLYVSCKFVIPRKGLHNIGIKGRRKIVNLGVTGFGVSLTARVFECYAYNSYGELEAPDINPIHKIREILTDDTAMNKPETSINDVNFIKAADRIYEESLGISWSITEKSCIDAINELCNHIEAGIRVNRQTGLYEMILFRDDWFEENGIHNISESKIKSMQYEITNADEVINQVNVNFYDRANIKNSSFSISESGLIQTLGRVNAETVDFPYFMNMRNAEIVANWKLKLLSTGVYKGTFTTGWREARKWNRYDLIRLPWSRRWIGTILVRIMSINLGGPTNNEVSIEFVEVVPSTGMMNTAIVADDVIDKPLPPQACEYEPFEMPYYLAVMALGQRQVDEELAYDSNFGLVGVVAEKPQENSLYAVMMTNNYDEWVRAGSIQYSLTTDSDQFISKTSSSFTVKNWKKISNVPVGTLIQCGREWLTGFVEWMVFQGVDPHTGVVSVKRGALDTQPQDWDLGLKLYFCGTDVAYDATEYVAGEKVLVSALTTTPSGVIELKGSNLVEMKARAIRPYPPANIKINGAYWPTLFSDDFEITWANRNRTQQTGGEIIGYFEGTVTLESNTQTLLTLTEFDINNVQLATNSANVTAINSYTLAESQMQAGTAYIDVRLKTVRDGYECLNAFEHKIIRSNLVAPSNIAFEVIEYV